MQIESHKYAPFDPLTGPSTTRLSVIERPECNTAVPLKENEAPRCVDPTTDKASPTATESLIDNADEPVNEPLTDMWPPMFESLDSDCESVIMNALTETQSPMIVFRLTDRSTPIRVTSAVDKREPIVVTSEIEIPASPRMSSCTESKPDTKSELPNLDVPVAEIPPPSLESEPVIRE